MIKKILLAIVLATSVLLTTTAAFAQNTNSTTNTNTASDVPACSIRGVPWLESVGIANGLFIPCGCSDSSPATPCGLNEMFTFVVNIMKLILGLSGSAALLMFVYGGFMFIISAGNGEQVEEAKNILSMAAIGLAIIFVSFLIVNTLLNVLTTGQTAGQAPVMNSQFGKPPSAK